MTTSSADGAGASPIVRLRAAAFGYGDRTVVSGVSLALRRGEVVALLGPNGSGKSTIVRGLLGLNQHLGGDVELFGVPRVRFREHSRIGYVPQRHSLSTSVRATVQEVVSTGRLPHRRWWAPATREDVALVSDALDLVGLADRAREDVSTLSGGQQRRVLIARALASQPDMLVMDEPTAGVDAANQQVLAGVLARLAERGTTMLIVTHELDALVDTVTRVVCTSRGHIDFDGSLTAYLSDHACAGDPQVHHHAEELVPLDSTALPGVTTRGPLDQVRRRTGDG